MTDQAASQLTVADFLGAAQALLPRGRAWPRDQSAFLTAYLRALATILQSAHAEFAALVDSELDPATTDALLDLWERAWGLPDGCSPVDLTLDERRAALKARISDAGGITREHYIELAAALGVTVTIDEFRPFTCNTAIDQPICDVPWRFTWRLNTPLSASITTLRAGMDCGLPLRSWGDAELECVIRSHNRPSRTVLFAYSGV